MEHRWQTAGLSWARGAGTARETTPGSDQPASLAQAGIGKNLTHRVLLFAAPSFWFVGGMLKLSRPPYAARIEALEHGVGRLDSAQMAACVRLPTLILRSRLLRCTFTVASVIRRMRAIPLFE